LQQQVHAEEINSLKAQQKILESKGDPIAAKDIEFQIDSIEVKYITFLESHSLLVEGSFHRAFQSPPESNERAVKLDPYEVNSRPRK